jgi:hypothetical protein
MLRLTKGQCIRGEEEERISVLRPAAGLEGKLSCTSHRFFIFKSVIGCIEPFKVTILIRLFFTGFECKKGAVGMIHADIGNTAP